MKKALLAAMAIAMVGFVVPSYTFAYEDEQYEMPVFGDEEETTANTVVQPRKHSHKNKKEDKEQDSKKEQNQNAGLPINLTADHAEYDSTSGDFHASGNVVIVQGTETLLTTYATGNMKTGDMWLEQGGTLKEPKSTMNGKWVHYNFNTKTGEMKEIDGVSLKDIFKAPHATIYPDRMVVDEGGTTARCPAVKHPPCLSVSAKTFEIYPNEKMVAHDVKVFVRGKHIYSRDLWVNNFNDEDKTKIMPRIGYDKDNGTYVKLEVTQPIDEKTMINAELPYYNHAGWRPTYGISRNERNFRIAYSNGWDEDDDNWYKKQNNWRFDYKPHHIVDGLPLSYNGYFEYGQWTRDNGWKRRGARNITSWHKEYALYLNHDPIYLFGSKNTVLNLGVGKKWVHESRTGDTVSSEIFNGTLAQRINKKWSTWVTYHSEHKTSDLFNINQPDMAKEVRNGLQYRASDRDIFTIINRFDSAEGENYETDYRWHHRFCCWAIDITYEQEHFDGGSNGWKFMYYFYNL